MITARHWLVEQTAVLRGKKRTQTTECSFSTRPCQFWQQMPRVTTWSAKVAGPFPLSRLMVLRPCLHIQPKTHSTTTIIVPSTYDNLSPTNLSISASGTAVETRVRFRRLWLAQQERRIIRPSTHPPLQTGTLRFRIRRQTHQMANTSADERTPTGKRAYLTTPSLTPSQTHAVGTSWTREDRFVLARVAHQPGGSVHTQFSTQKK